MGGLSLPLTVAAASAAQVPAYEVGQFFQISFAFCQVPRKFLVLIFQVLERGPDPLVLFLQVVVQLAADLQRFVGHQRTVSAFSTFFFYSEAAPNRNTYDCLRGRRHTYFRNEK